MLKSSLCIAVALACSPMASSARHVGPELVGSVPGAAWLPVAVHDQTGTAKLSNLPDLLSRGIQPAGLALAGEVRRSTLSGGQDMGWVWMPALSDASIRQQAKQFFQSGVPVLVLGAPVTEAERRAIASVFGAASQASVAVYLRGKDGGLQVFSFHAPAAMPGVNLRAPLEQLVQGVENALASAQEVTSRSKRSLLRAASDATDPGELHALPRMNVIETQYASSKNGASVTLDATVIRNSTKDKDVFTIIAHSRYNLKPHDSGLSGGVLTVPYRYTMKQGIGINSDTIVPKLADQFPGSDPRTDLQISEKRATKTNYGFGIKPEISADLQGNVPTASAKIAFSFDYARENIYEKVVNFSAKDYFLSSSANSSLPRKKTAEWTMQLAPSIFGDNEHFGKSPSTTLVTPTMLSSAPETLAVWELDAKYQGPISLDAQSVIENAKFDGKASPQIAPDPQWQAVVNLYIPADSPYLTRETTVFIRSEKGSGGCLWDANGDVVLRSCPDTHRDNFVEEKLAQWYLDADGRYFNRGSGNCMQVRPSGLSTGGNQVETARCSLDNAQRWEWQADRIHSRYNGGLDGWRLHVTPGGLLQARISDPNEYQDLPVNEFNALLNPWSGYPRKPAEGAFIPSLGGGVQQPIPAPYLNFNQVGPDQTWKLTVLRQSLMLQ